MANRFTEIRERYEESNKDADELAEAALTEIQGGGEKGDEDAAAVAAVYAILAVSRRLEIATDILLDALEGASRG